MQGVVTTHQCAPDLVQLRVGVDGVEPAAPVADGPASAQPHRAQELYTYIVMCVWHTRRFTYRVRHTEHNSAPPKVCTQHPTHCCPRYAYSVTLTQRAACNTQDPAHYAHDSVAHSGLCAICCLHPPPPQCCCCAWGRGRQSAMCTSGDPLKSVWCTVAVAMSRVGGGDTHTEIHIGLHIHTPNDSPRVGAVIRAVCGAGGGHVLDYSWRVGPEAYL